MKKLHDKEQFTGQLLAWYDEHKRILPWRDQPTPYAVWVSEIMLQQTRVEAVKPYFHRFMNALPSIAALAECDDDTLAKLWEGLGYYNRVRNMKKAAIICMQEYDGTLPNKYEQLLALPGIGAYTAGAIASIAYRIKVPAVDGNVLRVFSRVLLSYDDIMKESTKKKFQAIIQTYMPDRPDAFNQALMEIGAMICIPNGKPHCERCPLSSQCMGYQSKKAEELPIKQPKKQRTIEQKTVIVLMDGQYVHLNQRSSKGLLANLYEFDMKDGVFTKEEVTAFAQAYGTITQLFSLSNAKHIFTHKEWHMSGWLVLLSNHHDEDLWVNGEELQHTYALPTAIKVYKEYCLKAMEGVLPHE